MPEKRKPCAEYFKTKVAFGRKQCESYGCCYDEDGYGAPSCFKRRGNAVLIFVMFCCLLLGFFEQSALSIKQFEKTEFYANCLTSPEKNSLLFKTKVQ